MEATTALRTEVNYATRNRTPHEVRVRVRGFEKYRGYSDLVETYCCFATSCYYVVFPAIEYKGYFNKWDVAVKKKEVI